MKITKIAAACCLALLFVSCSNGKIKEKTETLGAIQRRNTKPMDNAYSLLNGKDYPRVENNFGKEVPYLQPVNDTKKEDFFEKYDEKKAMQFFKNLKIEGYGSNSMYWRWKTSISKSALFQKIAQRIPQISARGRRNVFVLKDGVWLNNQKISDVGSVKDMKVLSRGASGVITHLLVETSKGSYLITKEYNIRRLLATNGKVFGARSGSSDYGKTPIAN